MIPPDRHEHTRHVVSLDGVPETLLLMLHQRAAVSRRSPGVFHDPEAERIYAAIDYPFAARFGPPSPWGALRARAIDARIRSWLLAHPAGTVVGLGEGLETQFERVDNGTVRWLSVDLPEAVAVRRTMLRPNERRREVACSALDPRWLDEIGEGPVFVTAAGLLMYFEEWEVARLIGSIAERLPGAQLCFDVIPRLLSRLSARGRFRVGQYVVPPMPWGIDADDLSRIRRFHPGVAQVVALPFDQGERGTGLLDALGLRKHLRGTLVSVTIRGQTPAVSGALAGGESVG